VSQWYGNGPNGPYAEQHRHHGGHDDFAGLEGLLGGALGGEGAHMVKSILHGPDRQFWIGALIGAGAVMLATSPAVRDALSGLFGEKKTPEPAPEPPAPAPAAKPKRKRAPRAKPQAGGN
jgi:hypothetical protein